MSTNSPCQFLEVALAVHGPDATHVRASIFGQVRVASALVDRDVVATLRSQSDGVVRDFGDDVRRVRRRRRRVLLRRCWHRVQTLRLGPKELPRARLLLRRCARDQEHRRRKEANRSGGRHLRFSLFLLSLVPMAGGGRVGRLLALERQGFLLLCLSPRASTTTNSSRPLLMGYRLKIPVDFAICNGRKKAAPGNIYREGERRNRVWVGWREREQASKRGEGGNKQASKEEGERTN